MGCTAQTIDGRRYAVCDDTNKKSWEAARNLADESGPVIGAGFSSFCFGWKTLSKEGEIKRNLNGVCIGLYNNNDDYHVNGLQVGIVNEAVSLNGVQLGAFNKVENYIRGVQLSVVGFAKEVRGIQVGAYGSICSGTMMGAQVALLRNSALNLDGFQVSAVMNNADNHARGIQITGLLNYVKECDSVTQLGLFDSERPHLVFGDCGPPGDESGILFPLGLGVNSEVVIY